MTNVELEGRLRSAATAYERLAPVLPDLERRIFARIAVTPREDRQHRGRSWPTQLLTAAALVAFAVAVAFLIREAKLFGEPQPVVTPSPSPQSLSVSGPGGWKYSGFGFGGWNYSTIAMVSPTVGWERGGALRRTADGGAHWKDVTPRGAGGNFEPTFLDGMHAWVIADSGARLTTFRTMDGGLTWQQGRPIMANEADAERSIQGEFVDPIHGWLMVTEGAGVDARLYRTTNGGLDWQLEATNSTVAAHTSGRFGCPRWCAMTFASPSTGWIANIAPQGRPSLLVSHDGGVTWKLQTLPPAVASMGCPCYVDRPIFSDQNHGFLLVWSGANVDVGHLLVTSDGGRTWTIRSLPDRAVWEGGGFYDANDGWVIAGSTERVAALVNGTSSSQELPLPLYRTDDAGMTWVRVPTALKLKSKDGSLTGICFLNQTLGFATWGFSSGQGFTGFQLLQTSDGGRTWSVVFTNRSP